MELPNLYLTEQKINSEKNIDFAFKSIKSEWNYSDDFLMKIAKHFECATESNRFLDILDGQDDLELAWIEYCSQLGIEHEIESNPFLDDDI